MTHDTECIDCGAIFTTKFKYEEEEEKVVFCVNCGSKLEDDLDENFYNEEEWDE